MRESAYNKLNPQFINRWSPRSFLDTPIPEDEINTIIESARWSPSCYNDQPWRFVYATDGENKEQLLSALVDANREWAQHAPLIAYAFSYNVFDHNGKHNRWAEFDTGAAWMALTLQANHLGYHTHAMGGFDEARAYEVCDIDPETHSALCGIVIGKVNPADQANEVQSERNSLEKMLIKK